MKNTFILFVILVTMSCSEDYLDVKPNKAIVVPGSLSDLESILNRTTIMNTGSGIGVLSVDDFFFTDAGWSALISPTEQYGYTWEKDVYRGLKSFSEWRIPYQQIFCANTVLDILPSIPMTSQNEAHWKDIKGRALFHRAFAHFQLAQVFCQPYYKGGESNLGIPVRTTADMAVSVTRTSVQQTYEQIIADLEEADDLLPVSAIHVFNPCVASAKAMLAKVNLAMENYQAAETYASEAIDLHGTLMDFNTLTTTANRPIPMYNTEVLFQSVSSTYQFPVSTLAYVDTLLYEKYELNDLRKSIFFRNRSANRFTFKGTYTGTTSLFTGLAIDEVYLNRAESRARIGNLTGALEDLNTLLATRYKTGTFIPISEENSESLLARIILERQKELMFRPERWTDIRRLNLDTRFQRTMARKLNGQTYTIPPNDLRFVYEIPPDEISYSLIEQNPR